MGDFSTLNELRATAVHEHAPPPVHRSGGGNSGIFSPDERADEEALLAALPSGVGGGVRLADDPDTRKFRSDKLSRIFRLQRGTRCFRFTLLFLSVLIVFSGAAYEGCRLRLSPLPALLRHCGDVTHSAPMHALTNRLPPV